MEFFTPSLHRSGRRVARSGSCITFISGSSAWGEPIPPHFQFPTRAKQEENQRIKISTFSYMKQIRGTFGNRGIDGSYKERDWGCTVGMNGKGGMGEEEFAKYIERNMKLSYVKPRCANLRQAKLA